MRKRRNKLFYVSKHAKVTETALQVRIAFATLTIVFCMAMMSLSAFAFFTTSISSDSNTIRSANFEMNITDVPSEAVLQDGYYVIANIPDVVETTETLVAEETGEEVTRTSYSLREVPTTFTFELSKTGSAATAYCVIEVLTDKDGFREPQIWFTRIFTVGDDRESVTVEIPAGNTVKIRFIPQWHTASAAAEIANGRIVPQCGTPVLPQLVQPALTEETGPSTDSADAETPADLESGEGAAPPAEPQQPAEPDQPVETQQPAEPDQPAETQQPAEMEQPAETEETQDSCAD